jgi:hypothetical protein
MHLPAINQMIHRACLLQPTVESYTPVWKECGESLLGHVISHIWPVHSLVTIICR